MLQERTRLSKYVSLSTTGEAYPSDAVSIELMSDTARSFPSSEYVFFQLPVMLTHPEREY